MILLGHLAVLVPKQALFAEDMAQGARTFLEGTWKVFVSRCVVTEVLLTL